MDKFVSLLNQVSDNFEPIVIQRPERDPVYLMSAQDYELFQQLLEEFEEKENVQVAQERLHDPHAERVSFEDFFVELEQSGESL